MLSSPITSVSKFINVAPYTNDTVVGFYMKIRSDPSIERSSEETKDMPYHTYVTKQIYLLTLRKRWKAATGKRAWPYRTIRRIEKQIADILQRSNPQSEKSQREQKQLIEEKKSILQTPVYIYME